jgi:hypothetical protein
MHIIEGSHGDNMKDKVSRRRQSTLPGVSNPAAKLTEDDVREIRRQYRKGEGVVLAAQYGVARSQICRIATSRAWKHII